MATYSGRISEPVFKGVTGTLFGLAIAFATFRLALRYRKLRQFILDDFVLTFACFNLIAAHVVLYIAIQSAFLIEAQTLDSYLFSKMILASKPEFVREFVWHRKMVVAFASFIWTAVYSVKLCLLLLFQTLVTRLPTYRLVWRVAVAITLVSYIFCISTLYLSCHHTGFDAYKCFIGSTMVGTVSFHILRAFLGMLTDLLILIIPFFLLWNVGLKVRQKLLLGLFTGLSFCMVIIALVRASGLVLGPRKNGITYLDLLWVQFWEAVEGNVSVIMVSVTTIRMLLRTDDDARKKHEKWCTSVCPEPRRIISRDPYYVSDDDDQLPSAPGAALIEMQVYVKGNRGLGSDTHS